ncbi:MAG: membrane dipeptidase, partial [Rhodospirillales bacterium]|nr:membrane dipeptidase [Rhodospirillales bacterium]MDE1907408.1 membrane dipeptidase [Rhodospirillales bacterium]
TAALAKRGYGREEISKIWGGNFLRLMRKAETIAAERKAAAD